LPVSSGNSAPITILKGATTFGDRILLPGQKYSLMLKALKKFLFPSRYILKRIESCAKNTQETCEGALVLQRKKDIGESARVRHHLARLAADDPADVEISPSFRFVADDLRLEVTNHDPTQTIICTLALGDSFQKSVAPCLDSQREYARRWGHAYVHLANPPSRYLRHPAWYKIPLVYRLSLLGYKQIAFLDADILITQPKCSLSPFFDRLSASGREILIANDEAGLNTGIFFARGGPKLDAILNLIWAFYFDPKHETWEQITVRTLADEYPVFADRLLIAGEPREFNSFPRERLEIHRLHHQANTWQPGDFACHFSGIRSPELGKLILSYQQQAKN
jgi:hypothetical protein